MYDVIISDETAYCITLSEVTHEMIKCLIEYGIHVDEVNNIIQVIEYGNLPKVLRLIVGFFGVKKIKIIGFF